MSVQLDKELEGINKENLDCHIEQCDSQESAIWTILDSHDLVSQFEGSNMDQGELFGFDLIISLDQRKRRGVTDDRLLSQSVRDPLA